MLSKFRYVFWIAAVVLIGNFVILRIYGDTLMSTHLFIVRGTVFYPYAWLNLIMGIAIISILVWELFTKKRT